MSYVYHWVPEALASGSTPSNITMTTAALVFSGFAESVNAKAMMAVSQRALTFSGFALGTNAKAMLSVVRGTVVFAGTALGITGGMDVVTAIYQHMRRRLGLGR